MNIEKFKYKVILWVEVEAFDDSDAFDALQDTFGVGTDGSVEITQCEYTGPQR